MFLVAVFPVPRVEEEECWVSLCVLASLPERSGSVLLSELALAVSGDSCFQAIDML